MDEAYENNQLKRVPPPPPPAPPLSNKPATRSLHDIMLMKSLSHEQGKISASGINSASLPSLTASTPNNHTEEKLLVSTTRTENQDTKVFDIDHNSNQVNILDNPIVKKSPKSNIKAQETEEPEMLSSSHTVPINDPDLEKLMLLGSNNSYQEISINHRPSPNKIAAKQQQDELRKSIAILEKANADLSRELKEITKQKETNQIDSSVLEEMDNLKSDLLTMKEKLHREEQKSKFLMSKNDNLDNLKLSMNILNNEKTDLESQVDTLQRENTTLKGETNSNKAEVTRLKAEVQKYKNDTDQQILEKMELKNEISRVKRELEQLTSSHEQRLREIDLERKKTDDIVSYTS